jgi:hypothetical protein
MPTEICSRIMEKLIQYLFFCFITLFIFTSCSDKVLKEMQKRENGEIVLTELYDKSGNVIQRKRYTHGQEYLTEEYIFVNGKIMHASFVYENSISSIQYFYVNNLLMKYVVSSEGQIQTLTEYSYNDEQLAENIIHHDLATEQTDLTKIEYTPSGNKSVVMMFRDGILSQTDNMFYDDNNRLMRKIKIVHTDTVSQTTYTYNKTGKLSGLIRFSEGSETLKVNQFYNKNGRLYQTIFLDEYGFIVRVEKSKYNFKGLKKAIIITDYRNFEGRGKKNIDKIRFTYSYY